ncbi:MAG: hypothetical protein OXP28_01125 [Gammaproteobacteria bacterium]|nr:hypothetical protein [bacterium]MDE0223720.1 hypothetical protein [Gammaproteobacteria bacterium]
MLAESVNATVEYRDAMAFREPTTVKDAVDRRHVRVYELGEVLAIVVP